MSFSPLVIHVEGPQSQGVEVNDSVVLTCRFIAGNPVNITWMKDGVQLSEGGPTVAEEGFGRRSTLSIDRVEFSNCGNYTCSVGDVTSPPAELGVYREFSLSVLSSYLITLPPCLPPLPPSLPPFLLSSTPSLQSWPAPQTRTQCHPLEQLVS